MGVVETNVVRRVNELVVKDLPWPVYQRLVKNLLAVNVLAARPGAVPLRLPAEDQDWVLQKSKEMAQALREAGYEVTGDLDDLLPATGGPEPRHPDDVGDAETLDAAIYALAGLLHELEAERERAAEEREALVTQLVPRPFRWAIDRYRDARVRIHELRTR
jgi:phage terminase large subunit GpA-like protein